MTDPVSLTVPLPTDEVGLGDYRFGNRRPLFVISGPCVLEDEAMPRKVAGEMKAACEALGLAYVFKASFDKANRTSIRSFRGPGQGEGLAMLAAIREEFGVPVLSDVHTPDQMGPAAEVLDIVQIPAFLCRQTDLLVEAGRCGKLVNLKKGQFVAPHDMAHGVTKIHEAADGPPRVMLTERGASFGYNNLVVDMRGIPTMQRATGCPVIFDAGHSVQAPGGLGAATGGDRTMIPVLARSAVAAGCDGLFIETHPDPDNAKSDGPNSFPLAQMPALLMQLAKLGVMVRGLGG